MLKVGIACTIVFKRVSLPAHANFFSNHPWILLLILSPRWSKVINSLHNTTYTHPCMEKKELIVSLVISPPNKMSFG